MAKSFDFNKLKPKTMIVTLSDEEKTKLIVKTPTKALQEELTEIKDALSDDADDDEALEALYEVVSKIMSNNTNNIKISVDKLKDLYDDSDYLLAFLQVYYDFVNEFIDTKK